MLTDKGLVLNSSNGYLEEVAEAYYTLQKLLYKFLGFYIFASFFIDYLGCKKNYATKVSDEKWCVNVKTLKPMQKHVVCDGPLPDIKPWVEYFELLQNNFDNKHNPLIWEDKFKA